MSFAVLLKEVTGLRGHYDRIAKLTFRNKTQSSDVYEFCTDAFWEEEFDWKVDGSLKAMDYVEIQIFNHKLIKNRLIAHYQVFCKRLLEEPWITVDDFLVDNNSTVIKSRISLELIYVDEYPRESTFELFRPEPEKMRVLEDWELESRRSSRRNSQFSLTSSLKRKLGSISGSMTSSQRAALLEEGGGDDAMKGGGKKKKKGEDKVKERFNLHPKVRVKMKPQREDIDFNVQIRVIEGKNIAGTQLDPVLDIILFGEKKTTQVKEQTNNPFWDEFFVFETTCQKEFGFDEIINFELYSGRNIISKGELLGTFQIDVGMIYAQPDHRFIKKYACVTDPEETLGASGAGIKGYLKMDITVLVTGDPIKEPPTNDDDDVDSNPFLPDNVKPERLKNRLVVGIYRAEGLPKMNSGILANIRKAFSGETRLRDLADPFVTCYFAGLEGSTSVIPKCYDPEWIEEIVFCDLFPSLCRRIKIQLRDKDVTKNETVGTFWIDLSEISNNGCNVNKFTSEVAFAPTFGPTWFNLYGSTRDFTFIDQNEFLNEALEEGIGYRGRVLLSVRTEDGESASNDDICNTNVKGAIPISDMAGGKEETFQLFCCIYEASMIDEKTASKPIQFEMNTANFGNTFDGKMISFKDDDDDDEEEEDLFVQPLTQPFTGESLDDEYFNLPINEKKPTMAIRFDWEDQRRRCYLTNIMVKYRMKLEDELDDVEDRLNVDAPDTFEYLQDALKEFIKYSRTMGGQLKKITGPKAGITLLDMKRLKLCQKETEVMKETAEKILESLTDNERIRSNYAKVLQIRDRIDKLAHEPQAAMPDVFIWLLSGQKRIAYVRIPPHHIMYSPLVHESGKDAGKLQTYLLSLPGKSGLGEAGWAIQCKLTCLIWLGVLKNKKEMLGEAPEEYLIGKMYRKSTAPPPPELKYTNSQKFMMRSHLYQARGLIGSDDSGLSDAFCRVIFLNQAAETRIIFETRSPTWNQMLIYYDLIIWGDMDSILNNPPTIMAEIFDYDEGGDIEFIGRAMVRPLVKKAEQKYEGPLFPPKLEWFQIYRGDNPAGELLAAFELFQLLPELEDGEEMPEEEVAEGEEASAGNRNNLPLEDPVETEDDEGNTYFLVPENIQPTMAMHSIECLFWGVREMKKIQFQAVEKPQVTLECVGDSVSSPIAPSAKINPNFENPWAMFDLLLPAEDRYCPPLTISVREKRWYGSEILIGTSIVNSLLKYLQDPSALDEDLAGGDSGGGEGEAEGGDGGGDGTDNAGFEGDGEIAPSLAGSKKALSIAGSKVLSTASKALSVAGTIKTVSFAPLGSKAPSRATSRAASRAASRAPSRALSGSQRSILKTPGKTPMKTPPKSPAKSTASSKRSRSSAKNRISQKETIMTPMRRASLATAEMSSKIHYHIRSNPGSTRRTPMGSTPSKRSLSGSASKERKKSTDIITEEREHVTPFKKLMEKKETSRRNSETASLLGDKEEIQSLIGSLQGRQEASPGKKSLIEQISTPIKSLGSKIATPIRSLTKSPGHQSQAGSKAPSKTGSKRLAPDDIENIELHMGAEASDFYEDEECSEGEGGEEETDGEQLDAIAEEGEGADGEGADAENAEEGGAAEEGGEGGEEGGEGAEEGGEEGAAPAAVPALEEEEEEEEEDEETSKKPEVRIGEEELKAEQEALAAEAEEEGEEEEKDEEDDEDNEDQVDWWSRFYETLKDVQRADEEKAARIKKKKREAKKKGIEYRVEDDEEEQNEDESGGKKKKIINPKIVRLKIFKTELEEVEEFDGFNDVLHSFTLLRGKSNGNDDDDESRIYGKFKGAIKVWRHPLPALFATPELELGSFQMLPTSDPVNVLCRVYVVKGVDLSPTDLDGKADPFVQVKIGKHVIKDKENYVAKNLNPSFGRVFDMEILLPHDNMLTIGVYDYDMIGTDDLIGETKIDVEDRFFSKHRATCGMSIQYAITGFNKWRDPIKPTAVLQRLCRDYKLKGPTYKPGRCLVETEEKRYVFYAPDSIMDDMGNPKQSEEPSALKGLHNFHLIDRKGYHLVPEHVETRSLFSPDAPGIEKGRVQLWVDLFDMDGPSPGSAVDITPRKPTSFELRVVIWNTEDVDLGDINILTGQPCADIYVKGWVEGLKNNQQCTDVHTSSLTGEGNFNWRFIFPFKYHKAEDKVVIIKKASLFSWDATEEKIPGRLVLQCWDSDALSSDDFIGDVTFTLTSIPRPSKTSVQCKLETMENENKDSIFKKTKIRGWWPFILDTEEEEPRVSGKVEAELELFTEQQAEEDPAGLGRKEPNPLPFPNRPDIMMEWMMNPLKALRYFLWEQYKFCFAKFLVIGVIFAIMGLFFYSMPGFLVKKLFGA